MNIKNKDTAIKFPLWFTILTAGYFVSNLLIFGILSLVNPSLPFPDMGDTAAAFPIQFFAIHHIAFSIPLLFGLIRKDVKVLLVMYSIFLVMAILDVSLLFLNGYYIPVIGEVSLVAKIAIALGGFILPVSLALQHLSSYKQT